MLKIAVAATGKEADSMISGKLATAKHLFIVDLEKFEVLKIYDAAELRRDEDFARRAVKDDCEAIICGQIKRAAFDILYKEGVSRYDGAGKNVTEALKLLADYRLPMITDCIGGTGCVGADSGGECHEH